MPMIDTADGSRLFVRDWGTGEPVVFVSSWALGGDMWAYQVTPLAQAGLRCITYDRRGHGRSDDPGHGYEFDTLADDLAALLTQRELHDVTLVGHSMGCAEIARYLARHGTARVARVALLSPITPFLLQTPDNPAGVPEAIFAVHQARLATDTAGYFGDGAARFFGEGTTWPGPAPLSGALREWAVQLTLQTPPPVVSATFRAYTRTDFRPDMAAFTVPTQIIHGDADHNAPLELTGRPTAQAIAGSELRVYAGAAHGLFLTEQQRLAHDLLTFIRGELAAGSQTEPETVAN